MKSAESSIYLDVYSCIRAINKRYGLKRQIDIALLNAIYAAYLDGANLRVIDILLLEDLASQATIHSALQGLKKLKLVDTKIDSNDGRSKFVLPSKLALKRLKECDSAIQKCCRE
jgi:DNA-binding MarR family transcriptional regulator